VSQRGVQDVTPTVESTLLSPIGPYYALVIGNNNYRELGKLQTAVDDARAVAQLLHDRFGFQTAILNDATRAQILTALDDYRSLPEKSNLLIYYAGHGHKDVDAHRAYWLPVDAEKNHTPNWINATEITDAIRAIRSRHVLIISDSCWSGDLTMRSTGAAITSREHNAMLAKILTLKSRHIMSSGGDEPVADGGGNGHSVFTGVLLQSLKDREGDSFAAETLLVQKIKPRVAGRSQQTPDYAIVRDSDGDLGDFVFFRTKNIATDAIRDPRSRKVVDEPRLNSAPSKNPKNGLAGPRPKNSLKELLKNAPARDYTAVRVWMEERRGEILRRSGKIFLDAKTLVLNEWEGDLQRALAVNRDFEGLNLQLVDNRLLADVVLVVQPLASQGNDNLSLKLFVSDYQIAHGSARLQKGQTVQDNMTNLAREIGRYLREVRDVPSPGNN
jgi:hypothetical protein